MSEIPGSSLINFLDQPDSDLVEKDWKEKMLTLESFRHLSFFKFCCVLFLITHLYYSTLLGPQVKADLNLILRFAQSSDCRWVGHLSLGSRSVDNVGTQLITWWWWWWWWQCWWDKVDHMVTGYTDYNLQQFWKTLGPILGGSLYLISQSYGLVANGNPSGQVTTGNMALS